MIISVPPSTLSVDSVSLDESGRKTMSVILVPPSTIQVQSSILEYCRRGLENKYSDLANLTNTDGIRPTINQDGTMADGNFEHRVALAILLHRPLIEVELLDEDTLGATDLAWPEPEEY